MTTMIIPANTNVLLCRAGRPWFNYNQITQQTAVGERKARL